MKGEAFIGEGRRRFAWARLCAILCVPVAAVLGDDAAAWTRVGERYVLEQKDSPWKAAWIDAGPGISPESVGRVFYLRKTFATDDPSSFRRVRVSADSKYKLWVNGIPAARGPARFDPLHQQYDTLDISALIHPGTNVIAAEVVYWKGDGPATGSPYFQVSAHPGFLFESPQVCSDSTWKAMVSPAHASAPAECTQRVTSGNWLERVDGRSLFPNWETVDYDDRDWQPARSLHPVEPWGAGNHETPWNVLPRTIPPPEEKEPEEAEPVQAGVLVNPGDHPPFGFDVTADQEVPRFPVSIPADGKVHYVVVDAGREVTAFPRLELEGGEGAEIELTYAEAPSLKGRKGRRDELGEMRIEGYNDTYVTREGRQHYEPFTHRTFWYVRIAVKASKPLTLLGLNYRWTGYPFAERGAFSCSDETLNEIWRTGRYTARLCAHETYEDCPYYEQLQYVGDARLQALVGYYAFGDARLAANALRQLNASRLPEGLTQSRYPCRQQQVIPGFSLYWVLMLDDYLLYTGDTTLVRECAGGIHSVLWYFENLVSENGCLKNIPYWNFHDWAFPDRGIPVAKSENCILTTMLYKGALDAGARLLSALGETEDAARFSTKSSAVAAALNRHAWSETDGLYSDRIGSTDFSKHVNAAAILFDVADPEKRQRIAKRLFSDPGLRDTSLFFAGYLHQAAMKSGQGGRVLTDMNRWKGMLATGTSTWWEVPENSRSDCHAWSATPTSTLMQLVLGVRPVEPGFKRVEIRPFPGGLEWARGTVPTPRGDLLVSWKNRSGLELEVEIPPGTEADVIFPNEKKQTLGAGRHVIHESKK